MKQGIETLNKLAVEVDRQRKSKRDFLVDTRDVHLDHEQRFVLRGMGEFQGNEIMHEQVASKTGIPKKYYDLMREKAPYLLSKNVNHWFGANPEKRMIRTLDGTARALLSDRFRALDNWMVLDACLQALKGTDLKVESSQITDRKMYVQITFPSMAQEIGVALEQFRKSMPQMPGHFWSEVLSPGLVISNSEVGCGAVNVESLIYTYRCTNGAILSVSMKKYHVGKGLGGDDEGNQEIFSTSTLNQADKLFVMKMRDVMKAACNPEIFQANVKKIGDAAQRIIKGDVPAVVESVKEMFDLREEEQSGVLNHLIAGGDLSAWGLSSAVTRHAQDVESYDRAVELERIGGKIIELAPVDWQKLVSTN